MDVRQSLALNKARNLSFVQFAIQRSMGMMRIGSSPPTSLNRDWKHKLTLRNPINFQEKMDELLFNEDGSLLILANTVTGMCKLFDTKRKQLVYKQMIQVEPAWRLMDIMMTGPNEMAVLSSARSGSEAQLGFWDLRYTSRPVSSSVFEDQKYWYSSHYSKKDDRLLIHDYKAGLSIYSRAGVKQQTGRESSSWMDFVETVALSPDDTILVMKTKTSSYIIVRKVNLDTLIQDLQYLQPSTVASIDGSKRRCALGLYDHNERPQNFRNVPEIMNPFVHSMYERRYSFCTFSPPTVFVPKRNCYVSYDNYSKRMINKPVVSRVVRVFDLNEHQRQQQQQQQQQRHRLPRNCNGGGGDKLKTTCYRNHPLITKEMVDASVQTRLTLGRTSFSHHTRHIAVTSLLDHTVMATRDAYGDHVELVVSNDDHTPVQHLILHNNGCLVSNLAFSPNTFSLALIDNRHYLRWMDIEPCGRIVDTTPCTNTMHESVRFDTIEIPSTTQEIIN